LVVNDPAFDAQVRHVAELAMTPGWWAYAQQKAIEMEADELGTWKGIRSEVGKLVKAAGYKPRPDELGTWWEVKSEAQLEAEAKQARKFR
jgi:hypothetical protein